MPEEAGSTAHPSALAELNREQRSAREEEGLRQGHREAAP
jgi:hypothetical protein